MNAVYQFYQYYSDGEEHLYGELDDLTNTMLGDVFIFNFEMRISHIKRYIIQFLQNEKELKASCGNHNFLRRNILPKSWLEECRIVRRTIDMYKIRTTTINRQLARHFRQLTDSIIRLERESETLITHFINHGDNEELMVINRKNRFTLYIDYARKNILLKMIVARMYNFYKFF